MEALEEPKNQLVPVVDSQEVIGKLLPDTEIQEIYLLATISRNIIISQSLYFLDLYQKFFKLLIDSSPQEKDKHKAEIHIIDNQGSVNEMKVGIIGCGRIGRALLFTLIRSSIIMLIYRESKSR